MLARGLEMPIQRLAGATFFPCGGAPQSTQNATDFAQ
jgi:hypothetical protein